MIHFMLVCVLLVLFSPVLIFVGLVGLGFALAHPLVALAGVVLAIAASNLPCFNDPATRWKNRR